MSEIVSCNHFNIHYKQIIEWKYHKEVIYSNPFILDFRLFITGQRNECMKEIKLCNEHIKK